ncbi:hypothetical protein ERO13_A05G303450v2 [Gossypium hirsutum]|nr:hypothetical protein ERO13_A05G303450v2 [Gossypium hirsutum]
MSLQLETNFTRMQIALSSRRGTLSYIAWRKWVCHSELGATKPASFNICHRTPFSAITKGYHQSPYTVTLG